MKIITNINSFELDNLGNILAVQDKNKIINLNDKNELYKGENGLQSIRYKYPFFFVNDIYGNGIVIKSNLKCIEFNEIFIKDVCSLESFIVSKENTTKLLKINEIKIYDLFKGRVFYYILDRGFIYYLLGEYISVNKVSLNISDKSWQYSLEEIPNFIEFNEEIETKVEQFLGIYDNKLWIHLNGERLLALDTETGKQVYLLKNIYKGHGKNFLNKERGVIQILAGHHYGEFDLHQLKYTTEVKLDKEEKVFIRSCTFYENNPLIYFCGRYNHIGFPNSYGIFDSEKLEIVWYKIGEKKQYFLDPPKANDKNLVILDNQLNLYIYEIEYD